MGTRSSVDAEKYKDSFDDGQSFAFMFLGNAEGRIEMSLGQDSV